MSRTHSIAVVAVAAGLAATAGADVVSSSFDASAEGWMLADGNAPQHESTSVEPEFLPAGGNDGGAITTPIDWRGTGFFVAPDSYLGDQSDKLGGSVLVDRRFIHPDSSADTMQVDYLVDMTMSDAGGSMTLAVDLAPVSLVAWETFDIALGEAGGWFHLDSGVAATDADIAAVLGDLGDIRVRGNVRDSFGRIGVDNFGLVPTPGTLAMLGLTGLFAARRRR